MDTKVEDPVTDRVKDPVCGMLVDPTRPGAGHDHDGVTYYFCKNPRCLERFKADPAKYLAGAAQTSAPATSTGGAAPSAPPTKSESEADTAWICPMDPEVRQSTPGPCPKCGMSLEPEHPVAPVTKTEWTCPMHPEIVRDAPGSCPICGMALEPRVITEKEPENHELVDMTRRFRASVALTIPVLVLTMSEMLPPVAHLMSGRVADPVKATTADAIRALHAEGVRIVMLTGDGRATAEAVGRSLGLDEVIAEVLPEQKAEEVKRLQKEGHVVAMAGDGINDAPALVQAEIGIAMGTGTDIAMESADVTLLKGDLRGIVRARALSRATMSNIKQNLFFAFVYNSLGIPLAAGVLYPHFGLLLSPMIAAAAMSFSSVSVIGNALRLRTVRI